MPKTVIRVENLWKQYRLGTINHGTLKQDIQSWWARMRGRYDPNAMIDPSHQPVDVSTTHSPPVLENPRLKAPRTKHQEQIFYALRNLNFEVRQGETLGIIGKNGAGKSTLLKILSRVTTPTRGTIKLNGRVASLLEIGTGFHPELTGRENVFLNGTILGMKKNEIHRKFDDIVHFAGVEQFIDTPVKRYSSGMYVRLAFAVAAHIDPDILVVDEVLAIGDADFQKKCVQTMQDSAGKGRTVLFVSHNMESVRSLCSRGILLERGEIADSGEIDHVIESYLANPVAV